MNRRMWPKAAILVVISLYFGLIHATLVEGPTHGPGRTSEGQRLAWALRAYYAEHQSFHSLDVGSYHGATVIPLILEEVLRHTDGAVAGERRRNQKLIAWAQQLAMTAGSQIEPFTRGQIARHTARLLTVYPDLGQTRSDLIMILDRLELWGAEHLPFLARRAGSTSDDEADEFGTRALILLDQTEYGAAEPMVNEIRRQREPRRPAQWALLAQSGWIRDDELAQLLTLLAHEFAANGGDVELVPELLMDEPLRDVLERVVHDFEDQHELVHSAFFMAQDQSEDAGDEDSPRVHRRAFFKRIIEGTLFTAGAPSEADIPPALNHNTRDVSSARPTYQSDGKIIRLQFGAGCESGLR